MFKFIKIIAIAGICFSSSAFAHWHHGYHEYGYGYGNNYGYANNYPYNPYYAGGYAPAPVIIAPPQRYYVQPPVGYGYAQPAPIYGQYRDRW